MLQLAAMSVFDPKRTFAAAASRSRKLVKEQINGGSGARRLGMIKPKLTTFPMLANIVTSGFEGSMNPLEASSRQRGSSGPDKDCP